MMVRMLACRFGGCCAARAGCRWPSQVRRAPEADRHLDDGRLRRAPDFKAAVFAQVDVVDALNWSVMRAFAGELEVTPAPRVPTPSRRREQFGAVEAWQGGDGIGEDLGGGSARR